MICSEPLIKECCRKVLYLPGDAAEIGVWRGESASFILRELPDTHLHLFDTFTGMPASMHTPGVDVHPIGDFNAGGQGPALEAIGDDRLSRVTIYPGVFPETAKGIAPQLKFVHVDCDFYLSTKAAIEWAWPLLVPGGILLDDDYAAVASARIAVDEFTQALGLRFEVVLHRAILRKPQ